MILTHAVVTPNVQHTDVYALDRSTLHARYVKTVLTETHPIGLNAELRGSLLRVTDGWDGGKYRGEVFYIPEISRKPVT